jgi:hypothetical protein
VRKLEKISGFGSLGNRAAWLVILFLVTTTIALGQGSGNTFYKKSLDINNAGMVVLGSWALSNIAIGAYGWSRNSGQRMYFHQMNLFWNSVNLAIAGIALYSNTTTDYSMWTTDQILTKQLRTQRIFLINAGLDIIYMGTALGLKKIASRYPDHQERLTGYGNSVLLQGAFLFVFDLVLFGLQRAHRIQFLDQLSFRPAREVWGMALSIQF